MVDKINTNDKLTSPYFSIIIPTYSRAHLIEIAVKSVLTQSFKNCILRFSGLSRNNGMMEKIL